MYEKLGNMISECVPYIIAYAYCCGTQMALCLSWSCNNIGLIFLSLLSLQAFCLSMFIRMSGTKLCKMKKLN